MRKGFSLIELTIAILIISLISAAVIVSYDLIQQSKFGQIIRQKAQIESAVKTFEINYEALPGDMANAEDFWGTYNISTNPNGTKNGNGDNVIEETVSSSERESLRAWQQLSKFAVIPGNYSGTEGASVSTDLEISVNIPESTFSGVGINFHGEVNMGTSSDWFYKGGNFLFFAKEMLRNSGANEYLSLPAFSSEELYNFDLKYDDGSLSSGQIRGAYGRTPDDSANSNCSYAVVSNEDSCIIAIKLQE